MTSNQNKSASSIGKSENSASFLAEPQMIDVAKIEKQLISSSKLIDLIHQSGLEMKTANFQSALKTLEDGVLLLKEDALLSEKSNYYLTSLYLDIFCCYFNLLNFELAENALEKAKTTMKAEFIVQNEEFQILYVRILADYLLLRYRQKDLEGMEEVKSVLSEYIQNQDRLQSGTNIIGWIIASLFGSDSFQTTNMSNQKTAKIMSLLHAVYLENIDSLQNAKDEYFSFLEYAKSEGLNELLLITVKRLIILERTDPKTVERLESYYQDRYEIFCEEDPLFSENFSIFELMFGIIAEISCMVQICENRKFEAISILKRKNNPELVKLVVKYMIRKTISVIRKINEGYYENESQNKNKKLIGEKSEVKNTNLSNPSQIIPKNVNFQVQSARPVVKRNASDVKWAVFEPLKQLLSGVTIKPTPQKSQQSDLVQILTRSLKSIETESSQSILNSLTTQPVFQENQREYEACVEVINQACMRYIMFPSFKAIKDWAKFRQMSKNDRSKSPTFGISPSKVSLVSKIDKKQIKIEDQGANKSRYQSNIAISPTNFLSRPESITKLNYSSRGKIMKYFIVLGNSTMRWADKPEYLSNPKLCHSVSLSTIKGVVYGKATSTFFKSGNKKLEDWLCFSIIFPKKSLDLYASETKCNIWVTTLSDLVKMNNPRAYCLTRGKLLWRKAKFLFLYFVISQIPEKQTKKFKKHISFCKAILLFKIFSQNLTKSQYNNEVSGFAKK